MRQRDPAPALPLLVFFALGLIGAFLLVVTENEPPFQGETLTVEVQEDFFREPSPFDLPPSDPQAPILPPIEKETESIDHEP